MRIRSGRSHRETQVPIIESDHQSPSDESRQEFIECSTGGVSFAHQCPDLVQWAILIAIKIYLTLKSSQNRERAIRVRSKVPDGQRLAVIRVQEPLIKPKLRLRGAASVSESGADIFLRIASVSVIVLEVVSEIEQILLGQIVNIPVAAVRPHIAEAKICRLKQN